MWIISYQATLEGYDCVLTLANTHPTPTIVDWLLLFILYLVGLAKAEIAPLHQNPPKTFSLLWLLGPELYFSRQPSHPVVRLARADLK